MPLVSVVVPYYQVEEYFEECLASLANQTLTDLEVIMVDDGSTDGSVRIAEQYVERDPRFRLVTQANQGLGPARNAGTAVAQGKYLMFVDSDDVVARRGLEQLTTSLEESGSDFAGGHVWRLSVTWGLTLSGGHDEPFGQGRRRGVTIHDLPLLYRDRMVWNKLWRREFWDAGGYEFPPIRFEDFPVTLRAHLETSGSDMIPEPVYVWRERASRTSISQLGHQLGNVQDRVTAAAMVIETVDRLGSRELRELVHSHLVDIDLREILMSQTAPHAEDLPAMERLAGELVAGLDPDLTHLAPKVWQDAARHVRNGDHAAARAITIANTPVQQLPEGAVPAPTRLRSLATSVRSLSVPRQRTAKLVSIQVDESTLTVDMTVSMDRRLARVAMLSAEIGKVKGEVTTRPGPGGLQVRVRFDTAALARQRGRHHLLYTARAAAVRWRGGIGATRHDLHHYRRAGYWVQASATGGRLAYEAYRLVRVVDATEVVPGGVRVHLDGPADTVTVNLPWPHPGVEAAVVDGWATLPLEEIAAIDLPDQPFLPETWRTLTVRDGASLPGPIFTSAEPVVMTAAGRQIELRVAANGNVGIMHQAAPETGADEAAR